MRYYGIEDVASNYPPELFDWKATVARRAKEKKPKATAAAPAPKPSDAAKPA